MDMREETEIHIQPKTSSRNISRNISCSAHCFYFLYHRCEGLRMREITAKQTEQKVTGFVNSLYSPDNELQETLEIESIH